MCSSCAIISSIYTAELAYRESTSCKPVLIINLSCIEACPKSGKTAHKPRVFTQDFTVINVNFHICG